MMTPMGNRPRDRTLDVIGVFSSGLYEYDVSVRVRFNVFGPTVGAD